MSMTKASSTYFDRIAGEWDTLRTGYFAEAVRQAAIAKAYLRPEMIVADVGAGTGFMVAGLAPLVSQVIALDGSQAMLEVARQKLARFNNITFQLADGQALPLDDASVEAVFANMYLHHCPNPQAAIREMARVLRPGGRLIITDLDMHTHEWMRQEMADEWLGFDRVQVRAWFKAAGLVNIIAACTGNSCCAESQNSAISDPAERKAKIGVFVATATKRVVGAREAVQANYGALATAESCCSTPATANQACCATVQTQDIVEFQTGYQASELAGVPQEAAGFSLGCGNPVALALLRPGQTVLDIGSGGGLDAFYAAKRVGPNGRVIGLDMTPAMIERARQSARAAGLSQVEFRLGQAESMPVEDNIVDVILSNCVINLCEDKGQVFQEAYRVLKDGGMLSISDMVSEGPLPLSVRGDANQWAGCVHGALPEQEYLDLLTQAGFQDITATRSEIGGEIAGVRVYSLAVSARKSQAAPASAACYSAAD